MNPALKQLARYIRDLLIYQESLILFGMDNEELINSQENYIVVDGLSNSSEGFAEVFDGNTEEMTYFKTTKGQVTISFYGVDAYENLSNFKLLQHSQKSYELQRDLGLAVFLPTNTTNLKNLIGSKYANRQDMDLVLQYEESIDVATLRIDEAQFDEFLVNN